MQDAEAKCLSDWRAELLSGLSGAVLEIGCGTGANLSHYPQNLNRLVLLEPNHYMRKKIQALLGKQISNSYELLDCNADSLPFPDNTFDAIVSTLVLCSANNHHKALSEAYRVLRPQGKLLFIEHVAASNNSKRRRWQRRLEPFWKIIACGCHLTRNTEKDIIQSGFRIEQIERQSMRGVPPIIRPTIRGVAIKT